MGVAPAADGVERAGYAPVFVERADHGRAAGHQRRRVGEGVLGGVEPGRPGLAPDIADDRRVGRPRVIGDQHRHDAEIAGNEAAVLVIARRATGRADDQRGAEFGRAARGERERCRGAPRQAHHADPAVAPGLRGDPAQDLLAVVLLLARRAAGQHAVRIAGVAHVDADAGIAVARQIAVVYRVAVDRLVGLAVGDVFEDRRHRFPLGVVGQPEPRREPRAVGEREPRVVDDADGVRQGLNDVHASSPRRASGAGHRLVNGGGAISELPSRADRSQIAKGKGHGERRFSGHRGGHRGRVGGL